jgi:methylenetetrahydrofolate dehydrogenase (NADP+)/methenyltetrahydrofolate cyclohydrolase
MTEVVQTDPIRARILDGAAVAREIRESLRARIARFTQKRRRPPRLGLLLAGQDAGSEIYVRSKIKSGAELGMETDLRRLPDTATLDEALAIVAEFNESDQHDGILVQSPLPAAMGDDGEAQVFDAISPTKDVDGFHPVNVGRLVQKRPALNPCTPSGVIELLDRSGIAIAATHAVVIGRSDIVGKPMALLLLHRHATVTICHSRTRDLPQIVSSADIVVAAVGRPAFVTEDFIKPGATVVDVGMNRLDTRSEVERLYGADSRKMAAFDRRGSVVIGDVHPNVDTVAGALTPVPGGVGPLTIAMLMSNTVRAAEARLGAGSPDH